MTNHVPNKLKKLTLLSAVAGLIVIALSIYGLVIVASNYLRINHAVDKDKSEGSVVSAPIEINGNELYTCTGNPMDQCKRAPSIDFYPSGSEGAINPALNANSENLKEIMGKITVINENSLVLQTNSGRLFTVHFPIDAITNFNTVRSPYYDNIKVDVGDTLFIHYADEMKSDSRTIFSTQLHTSSLLIKDQDFKATTPSKLEKY